MTVLNTSKTLCFCFVIFQSHPFSRHIPTAETKDSSYVSNLTEKKTNPQLPQIKSSSTYQQAEFYYSSPLEKNLISRWQGCE